MGFSGKPSKACEACRIRRTRCDLLRPQCSQCHRKNIVCTYRDLVNLAFRHENASVIRRVHQAQTQSPPIFSTSRPEFDLLRTSQVTHVSPGDAAIAFFMSKFAYGIYHDYVPALYRNGDCSPALKASVEAVGLATLSLARSEKTLLDHSRRCNAVAVQHIQRSLSSPKTVSRADTLASIMLLALFAGITCEPTAARIDWTRHIKGAMAALNSRGDASEEDDPVVNVLSSHITSCILVDCLQSAVGPPKQFQEIKFEPRIPVSFQEKSEYVLELLAELRHEILSKDNVLTTISRLDEIDGHLNDLLQVLPKRHPRTVVSEGLGLDEPVYHMYPSHASARVWNIIRLTKLSSHELRYEKMEDIQRYLDPAMLHSLNIDTPQQQEYAKTSAQHMIHDICASVPIFLRSPDFARGKNLINWAHSLLWPLSAARASQHAPEYLKSYMQTQLQNLWNVTGFPVVDYHKEILDDEVAPQIWTHVYFMC